MNPYFLFNREDRPALIPSWRYRLKREWIEFRAEFPMVLVIAAAVLAVCVVALRVFWRSF